MTADPHVTRVTGDVADEGAAEDVVHIWDRTTDVLVETLMVMSLVLSFLGSNGIASELGYCLRGESCPYSHGTNIVAINDFDKLQQFNMPMQIGAPIQPGGPSLNDSNIYTLLYIVITCIYIYKSRVLLTNCTAIPPEMMMGHAVPVFDPDMTPQMQPRGPRLMPQPHDQNGDSYVVPISKPYGTKRRYSDRDSAGTSFNQTMRENPDENSREGKFDSFLKSRLNVKRSPYLEGETNNRPGRGEKSMRGGRDKQRGGYQAGGHQQGPHIKGANRDNKTLDIIHIPAEYLSAEKLREHFEKFGSIIGINIVGKNKAQIEYSNHFEAKAAVKSPEAVFGNRFINVYWKREQPKEGEKNEDEQMREKPEVKPHAPVDPAAMKLISEEAEVRHLFTA